MKKLALRFLFNYLALSLWSLGLLLLITASDFTVFRNLQRAIEPADRVFIGVKDHANGRRELQCQISPGASQVLLTKLDLAHTLLLLEPGDLILEEHVPSGPGPSLCERAFFGFLTGLFLGALVWINPAGRLARCWRTRHLRPSQVKLSLAFALLASPGLSLMPRAVSDCYLQARVAAVVQQPHQVFRTWRGGHQGIVLVVYGPTAQLQPALSRALKLSPQDRLAVVSAPPPVAPASPSLWPGLLCLMAALLWVARSTPQQREYLRSLWFRVGRLRLRPRLTVERVRRHKLFQWL
jgi:hypothetical protein